MAEGKNPFASSEVEKLSAMFLDYTRQERVRMTMLSSLLGQSTSTGSGPTIFADALFRRKPAPFKHHALDPDLLQLRRAADIGIAV